ncbi:hypothetical protein V5799_005081 [Amblyomma americanum]|uniref:Secreted protein n=1 Tax=Amblyomma americanum TaxID=6943 RepID=A0AAQ4E098_AMBAM
MRLATTLLLLLALAVCNTSGQGQGKCVGRGQGQGHGQGRGKHGGCPAVGGPLVADGRPLLAGGGGQFRESGGFRQTHGHRVEEGFEQTDFYNQGRGNGAAFLGTNSGVLQSGLLQEVKGKFKIMGKVRGYTAASALEQQG